ncbi:hypothetical protein NKY44_16915 [Sinorhizobium meliloti]|uniref:hypothetical protein n=1 Tax=Rhizobium meliloti TaxID=382 RepID=UPI003D654A7D
MKGYKFLKSELVDSTIRGRIRLASLAYYRAMEGPQWIADRNDGVDTAILEKFTHRRTNPEAAFHRRKLSSAMGIKIEGNADNINFAGTVRTETTAPPCHIYCFSLEPFDSARKAMCEDAPQEYRYDACVEIADIDWFCRCVSNGKIDGLPLSNLMAELYHRDVSYEKKVHRFESSEPFSVDPFSKHNQFRYQQEYRLLFLPRKPLPDHVFVDFLVPPGLLQRKSLS